MPKDYKYGLLAGVLLAITIAVWLARDPRFSSKTRAIDAYKSSSNKTDSLQFVTPLPQTPPPPKQYVDVSKQQTKTSRFHVVAPGDTVSRISEQYYGSKKEVDKILRANPGIPDANKLKVGARLVIPD